MPYKTIAQLPPPVKNSLPAEAQRIYLAAFNAAYETYKGDEMKCAAVAWSAVKKKFKKDKEGAWVPVETSSADSTGHIDLFLSDVTSEVRLEKLPSGNFLARGLPVLQVGTWNGKSYTAEDLTRIAENFGAIQLADSWEPPMRPYHAYDREGKPLSHSASETLGWHKTMSYDPASERLLADVELVDAQAARDFVGGKLRYVSSEIAREAYTSPVTGKEYALIYMVGALVDNPAVKGMPWSVVLNAEEYGKGETEYEEPPAEEETDASAVAVVEKLSAQADKKKGAQERMGIIAYLKTVLPKLGAEEADLATLDQLEEQPDAEKPDAKPDEKPPVDTLAADGMKRQLELLEQANKDKDKRISTMEADRRQEKAQGIVEGWTRDGKLPPALGPQAFALVDSLMANPGTIDVLAQDEEGKPTTRKASALDLLAEIVAGIAPSGIAEKPQGKVWQGIEDPEGDHKLSEERLKAIAQAGPVTS